MTAYQILIQASALLVAGALGFTLREFSLVAETKRDLQRVYSRLEQDGLIDHDSPPIDAGTIRSFIAPDVLLACTAADVAEAIKMATKGDPDSLTLLGFIDEQGNIQALTAEALVGRVAH